MTLNGRRRALLTLVLLVFLVLGIGVGLWWLISGRYHESTDDAYVNGNLVQITPQAAGTVLSIHADDTDFVASGQLLVELDKADARVAVDQAEAQLARAVRSVRNLKATTSELEANAALRRSELQKAEQDVARRHDLEASGAVSGEELQHARDALQAAKAGYEAAQRQLEAQRTLVDRTSVTSHPDVRNAAAKVREAYLALSRTEIPAPVSGFVARRSVQVGQRVSAGAPLLTVVPLDDVWVDANFKESQLAHLRTGQEASLSADAYGGSVHYHGRVIGFGAGTGSAFALLPAQNATGNWIKVVQRVPVRIALDPKELREHPLQIGLSMQVEVDTHDRAGQRLEQKPRALPGYKTQAFGAGDEAVDRRIAAIITDNQ
jgi:membrane fusion protein (multidrug efflux system)